ncbi:glycosyltransferase [Leuconostoc holzapfelii]|nr:glycosyltransferase [Leuconostoc holzapfelii]
MKKILIFGATPSQGGIETFILNICKTVSQDKKIYLFKFSDEKIAYQDSFVQDYDAKVLNEPNPGGLAGHFYRKIQYRKFFKNNQFDVVHINANSPSNYDFAKQAIASGAKVIYHSHNDSAESFAINQKFVKLIAFVRYLQRKQLAKLNVKRLAVSLNAAKWMFGTTDQVQIVPNGVDFNSVAFSKDKRDSGRQQLNIDSNDKVLLVASRLSQQKNVFKSLSVAKYAIENGIAQHFVIVGDGQERERLNYCINKIEPEIKHRIHVLGPQSDMQRWYSVSDVMLMPSLYEGLPYSVLEAQANGLTILASNAIPKQAILSQKLLHFIDIEESDEIWSQNISTLNINANRSNSIFEANNSIYALENFRGIMEDIYETI